MVLSGAPTDLPVHAVGSGANTWILSITSFPPLHVHLSHCSIYCCIHFYSNGTGNHLTFIVHHIRPSFAQKFVTNFVLCVALENKTYVTIIT
jgi:hypothetical protein